MRAPAKKKAAKPDKVAKPAKASKPPEDLRVEDPAEPTPATPSRKPIVTSCALHRHWSDEAAWVTVEYALDKIAQPIKRFDTPKEANDFIASLG